MKVGRPTKYTPEMCNLVIEGGKLGYSVAELASECDVSIQTLYEWSGVHPDFSESFTRAQHEAEAFWARRIREGLSKAPSEFQGPANMKYMAQRFQERWSDKRHIEHSGGVEISKIERVVVKPE